MLYRIGFILLIAYSIFIIAIEVMYGQLHVREYLTDIKGDVMLYGINTTLTTLFLVLIAYNFILCALNYKESEEDEKSFLPFCIIQAIVFLYLAIDERFMLHERIGSYLGTHDHYVLILIGLFELFILYHYKEILWQKTIKSYSIYLAGILFGIMILIDAFGGHDAKLRLSLEDLSKIWAIIFLFIYSFEFYKIRQKINSSGSEIRNFK